MTAADKLSAPGSASYDSDTMTVGDGTWDFTKNTFLLPNLVGLNFETMQANGMGNRFSTLSQYHTLILGHGILAAIVFLFVIPLSVLYARFSRDPDYDRIRRNHAYMGIVAVGLSTVVFILGFFAVGPSRALTNPHHGIGVAIYVLILLQAIGGRMVKNIWKRSFRLMVHRWSGRTVAILGVVQVPLGLTLYGSPKFTFILYAVWMAFLLLFFFILSWIQERDRGDAYGGRSTVTGATGTEWTQSEVKSRRGFGWIAPLTAGVGALALFRRGRKRGSEHSGSSRSRSRSHSRRTPEVLPSRRGSASYLDEKYSERSERKDGGIMNKLLAVGGVLGAGALVKKFADRRESRRHADEEYSAVATDTPSRFGPKRSRLPPKRHDEYTESEFTEDRTELSPRRPRTPPGHRPRTPLLPGPGDPVATAAALSASAPRPTRPPTSSRLDTEDYSDYTSYRSPSRRTKVDDHHGGAGKGVIAALGLGWFAKKLKDRRDRKAEDERYRLEEERRDGRHGSRYTGDGFGTPTRPPRRTRPPPVAPTATTMTGMTATTMTGMTGDTESSLVESRPAGTALGGPPMPPFGAGNGPPPPPIFVPAPVPGPGSHSRSRSRSRHDANPVSMPPMPPDTVGVLNPLRQQDSGSESHVSAGGRPHVRHSSRQGREGDVAAADESPRHRNPSQAPSQPVSVKVKYHDDKDRNVTLRRLTEEEARREQRRMRSGSVSSLSGNETPTRRRYRRDSSSARKAADEIEAERLVTEPLSPPTPAFVGKRRAAGKDSAYYSGQPGPSGTTPMAAQTVSSIDSPDSHGTWSALSPTPSGPVVEKPAGSVAASAADRRRRRRLERNRDARPQTGGTVDFS
ncbi:hypothetical protein F5Y18DRAFT_334794 [Xylariaceae sp. FL1019]|nr:hypothetical protein F5Y18DRAFT_334794 [Xylariaceae sp. FL1019]